VKKLSEAILIEQSDEEIRVAIVENGRLAELHIERPEDKPGVGDLYYARVINVLTGLGCAFLDAKTNKNLFLPFSEIVDGEEPKEGQFYIVQVTKEAIHDKGPAVTTNISLPGRYVVYMPLDTSIGVSSRIQDRDERNELRLLASELAGSEGVIVRTEASGITARALKGDLNYQRVIWRSVIKRAKHMSGPGLLFRAPDLAMTIIREAFTDEIDQVLIDSPEKFKALRRYVHSFAPHLTKRIILWKDRISLFERYGIEEQIARLILNKVKLPSGGWIMIEQSEALTAIDVNSGGFTAQGGPEETAFQLNCEAAKEVMHQLRLRNIGGIIIVDFVDMADREHRGKLVQLLAHEAGKDKAKIDILPVTRLGLVQITRQRKTPSLAQVLCRECPWCHGSGLLLSPQTVYIQVKKKIFRSAPGIPGRRLDVSVHPDVGRLFDKKTISELSRRLKKEIHIRLDYTLHPNDCKLS